MAGFITHPSNPFIHIYKTKFGIIIWNSILLQPIFVADRFLEVDLKALNMDLFFNKLVPRILKEIKHEDIELENTFFSYDYCYSLIQKYLLSSINKPNIDYIYLILNRECNLRCKYCFLDYERFNKSFSSAGIKEAINWFAPLLNSKNENPVIIFYGGEPLLNFKELKSAVGQILSLKKVNKLPEGLGISLVTNGTLITKEIASYFAKNDIIASVSLDGSEIRHNLTRTNIKGQHTFKNALQGYKLLYQSGVKVGIATTITNYNIENIVGDLTSFIIPLKPRIVAYNIYRPYRTAEESLDSSISGAQLGKVLFSAYSICSNHGIKEGRASRIIDSIISRKPRINDCAGCGQQLCIYPDGIVTPCQMIDDQNGKNVVGSTKMKLDINNNNSLNDWLKYSPLLEEGCKNCPALSCCGGGCRLLFLDVKQNSYQEIYCEYVKTILFKTLEKIFAGLERNQVIIN